jgi:sulfur-carrier protein adenylyltransferase/sulfurtransferase
MFEISDYDIDPEQCLKQLDDQKAGGLVVFEGRVRNHNEGRAVGSLEYETYDELCHSEAAKIIVEAQELFDVCKLHVVHRKGHLQIEDVAVWVGVAAKHRDSAFKACRYVIDEVKNRLPIWKREHYVNADPEWVNCAGCQAHHHIDFKESDLYSRQVQLNHLGQHGQELLSQARVAVVGAGGLGIPVLQSLVAAGVKYITIIDGDQVEVSNLHRQVLYGYKDIAKNKAVVARQKLELLNPFAEITAQPHFLTEENCDDFLRSVDLVVDCADNFEVTYLVHDYCGVSQKKFWTGSVHGYHGKIFSYLPGAEEQPCLRCLWPQEPDLGCVGSCADDGILASTVGFVGQALAHEVLRTLYEPNPVGLKGLMLLDLWERDQQKISAKPNANCLYCRSVSKGETFAGLRQVLRGAHPDFVVQPKNVDRGLYKIIDIREQHEQQKEGFIEILESSHRLPMSCTNYEPHIERHKPTLLVCAKGIRSLRLTHQLRQAGFEQVYSLDGGLRGMKAADQNTALK